MTFKPGKENPCKNKEIIKKIHAKTLVDGKLREDIRLKISKALKGRKLSVKHRQNMSKSLKGMKNSKESKMKNRDAQLRRILSGKAINKTNTYPEKLFKNYLKEKNINYVFQYKVGKYAVDFFIPKTNTIIEVYGDYYHANPSVFKKPKTKVQISNCKRDKLKIEYLKKLGYNTLIVWELDIVNNTINIF